MGIFDKFKSTKKIDFDPVMSEMRRKFSHLKATNEELDALIKDQPRMIQLISALDRETFILLSVLLLLYVEAGKQSK